VQRSSHLLGNPVYDTMHGPDEFLISGTLKGWDRLSDLARIQTPTLSIGARWDEVDPAEIEKEARMLLHGSYGYCSNGSHLCMWDDQQSYFDQLVRFLKA
jgi:proline iminopeptidase